MPRGQQSASNKSEHTGQLKHTWSHPSTRHTRPPALPRALKWRPVWGGVRVLANFTGIVVALVFLFDIK